MSAAKKLIDILKEDMKNSHHKAAASYVKLVEIFTLQPITSKSQHEAALKVLEKLISYMNEDNPKDDGIETYFRTLTELVGDYERNQFKSAPVNGTEMLAYLIELQDLKQTDLSKELGGQPVVSKILKGERELNLRQIKALAKRFKVSPEVFI